MRQLVLRICGALIFAGAGLPAAAEWDFGGDVGAELRVFAEAPAFPGQFQTAQPSLILNGDIRFESEDGRHQIAVLPFYRQDGQDRERTHFDLREGYYRFIGDEVQILAGVSKVFWGVTESRHLVDIVNQTDSVEDIDEEDKLGQPMVQVSLLREWGKLDLFVLPYFRERTFPGRSGRLRFDPVIDTDRPLFEDGDDEWNTDFALRYSQYFGDFDVGVSLFSGTSREPLFIARTDAAGNPFFSPFYTQINQLGLDVQYTTGSWLVKFEGIVREGQGNTFPAVVTGFEYTLYGVTESGADLGLLLEILYDGRSENPAVAPVSVQENDIFVGTRLALNDSRDTSILAGAVTDWEDGTTSGLVEAERRLGQNWKGELEARFFVATDPTNFVSAFEDDSLLTLRMTRFF